MMITPTPTAEASAVPVRLACGHTIMASPGYAPAGGRYLCDVHGATMRQTTAAELAEARAWIADCWPIDVARLTDAEVIGGVARHYDGGWAGFRADGLGQS